MIGNQQQPQATAEMAPCASCFKLCNHQQPPKWLPAHLVSNCATTRNRRNGSLGILFQIVQPPATDEVAPCTSCFKLCNHQQPPKFMSRNTRQKSWSGRPANNHEQNVCDTRNFEDWMCHIPVEVTEADSKMSTTMEFWALKVPDPSWAQTLWKAKVDFVL